MAARILCIGNRFVGEDNFGPRVFDALTDMEWPADVEVIDGGLAGLDLLRFLDDGRAIVFVDAVAGYAPAGALTVIEGAEVARQSDGTYGHEAGLPFVLRLLPSVVDRVPSRIRLVGCEGIASSATVHAAARLGLQLAAQSL